MAIWNAALEGAPAQSDAPATLGTTGRETRTEVRSRWENEHSSYTSKGGTSGGSVAADMVHKQGSARAYYQASAPTLRPDGVTALGASDYGRLWVGSTGNQYVYTSSGWLPCGGVPIGFVYIQFYGQSAPADIFGGTWSNVSSTYAGLFFRAEGGVAASFDGSTQAGSIIHLTGCGTGTAMHNVAFPVRGGECNEYDSREQHYGGVVYTGQLPYNYKNQSIGNTWYKYVTRPVNTTIRIWKRTA